MIFSGFSLISKVRSLKLLYREVRLEGGEKHNLLSEIEKYGLLFATSLNLYLLSAVNGKKFRYTNFCVIN